MPKNDREVFEYFRSKPQTPPEVDHLAYAKYAYDKYEWVKKFEELNQRTPDISEENSWISHLPNSKLDEIHDEAYGFFEYAARKYMENEIEDEKKKAVNQSIVEEIKKFTSFWKNFLPNLFIGIVASLVFSILIIIMGIIFAKDPSPIALYKEIEPKLKIAP